MKKLPHLALLLPLAGILLAGNSSLAAERCLFPNDPSVLGVMTCRIINNEQADQRIRPPYREGWKL